MAGALPFLKTRLPSPSGLGAEALYLLADVCSVCQQREFGPLVERLPGLPVKVHSLPARQVLHAWLGGIEYFAF